MAFWSHPDTIKPKQSHRWILRHCLSHNDYTKQDVLPPYVFKSIDRPSFESGVYQVREYYTHAYNFPKKITWKPIRVELYDVILEDEEITIPGQTSEEYDTSIDSDGDLRGPSYLKTTQAFIYSLLNKGGYFPQNNFRGERLLPFSTYIFKDTFSAAFSTNFDAIANKSYKNERPYLQIDELDSNGNCRERWKLYNPFINNVSFGKLDYSSDNVLSISFEIVYDWAVLEVEFKKANNFIREYTPDPDKTKTEIKPRPSAYMVGLGVYEGFNDPEISSDSLETKTSSGSEEIVAPNVPNADATVPKEEPTTAPTTVSTDSAVAAESPINTTNTLSAGTGEDIPTLLRTNQNVTQQELEILLKDYEELKANPNDLQKNSEFLLKVGTASARPETDIEDYVPPAPIASAPAPVLATPPIEGAQTGTPSAEDSTLPSKSTDAPKANTPTQPPPASKGGAQNGTTKFVGDSIARGASGVYGTEHKTDLAYTGRPSKDVISTIKTNIDTLKGAQQVVLSTGTANTLGAISAAVQGAEQRVQQALQDVQAEISLLQTAGIQNVTVLGISQQQEQAYGGDINNRIRQMVEAAGYKFQGGFVAGSDKIHPIEQYYSPFRNRR